MTNTIRTILVLLAALALCFSCALAEDGNAELAAINSATITLNGDSIAFEGYGVTVDGTKATVTLPGVYTISGTLNDGQIIVDCVMNEKVELLLAGATIHCEKSAPINIVKSEKRTTIRTAADTQNALTCGKIATSGTDGVIYSKGDLTLTGEGALSITALDVDGIVSKDDLRIKGGYITVETPEDGIRGKDSVEIYDGHITVIAGGDGIKSTNETDAGRGFVQISGGEISITYGDEALQCVTRLEIIGGTINAVYKAN